ncbi:LysR family transcriptional regulator, partial [Acinetobacter baumannii]
MTMTPLDGSVSLDVNNLFRKPKVCFDWEDLHYFVMFSAIRSLSGAAKVLGVEHATVSRRIASLEKSLNVKL